MSINEIEIRDNLINDILAEDEKRYKILSADYDPVTGDGADIFDSKTGLSIYRRKKIIIKDHSIPVQYIPYEMQKNELVTQVVNAGSIKKFLKSTGKEVTPKLMLYIKRTLLRIRYETDPMCWFYCEWRIKNKEGAKELDIKLKNNKYNLVPFKLNHAQMLLLAEFEKLRLDNMPILIVLLKCRQWGGSTLTQSYMAWIQLMLKQSWYSVIVAQQSPTAKKIYMMYEKAIGMYSPWLLDIGDNEQLKFSPYGKSGVDNRITYGGSKSPKIARDVVVSIATYKNPDSMPGSDISLVHYSEVALWKKTDGNEPQQIIKGITGGLLKQPLVMEVMESTARGYNFFCEEYNAAKRGESSRNAVFIPWFKNIYDTKEIKDKRAFAEWIYNNRNKDECCDYIPEHEGKKCLNSGKYIWRLWLLGATLEGIMWYVLKRLDFDRQMDMASEAPSDDVEAFANTESLAFDLYDIDKLQEYGAKKPIYIGDIYSKYSKCEEALENFSFKENIDGNMYIWEKPQPDIMYNRYIVIVDIGGRWKKADWSVIRVFDRKGLMNGGHEKTVLMWHGHIDHDYLGYKAVQVAKWYNNALLVFESNTLEKERKDHDVEEGDPIIYILEKLDYNYDNLYCRNEKYSEDMKQGRVNKFGFHVNTKTKALIVNTLKQIVRDCDYEECDAMTIGEMRTYERRANNSYGSMPGTKDDRLMTAGIGLYVSREKMDIPKYKTDKKNNNKKNNSSGIVATEAGGF